VRPSERLTFTAAAVLVVVTAATWRHGAMLRMAVFASIALATFVLARASASPAARFVRDWLPVCVVLAMFMLLQPVIEAAVPWRLDAVLAQVDARWFSRTADAWRGVLGRPAPFTDAVYLAYFSYYLLPVTIAAIAWRRGPAAFEPTAFTILLGFYLTYLGYLLLPASGPRLPPTAEAAQLGGGAISDAVRWFLQTAEVTTLDAFPSGHTTIAVVSGVLGSRLLGRDAAAAVWAWAASIVFAAVYVHVHYVVDVLAGLGLAVVVLWLSPVQQVSRVVTHG
jgi:membrane-associated phospholipid phosphatase